MPRRHTLERRVGEAAGAAKRGATRALDAAASLAGQRRAVAVQRRHVSVVSAAASFAALSLMGLWHSLRRGRTLVPLRSKVVVITGGSRGLGLMIAREMGRHGAVLVLCARDPQELERARVSLVAERVAKDVLTIACDVSARAEVEAMVQTVVARFGRVDLLVNNAGVMTVGPLATQSLVEFEEAMAVMFWGMVYPTLAVLPFMRAKRSGTIVNVTSIGARVSIPHMLPYASAKFAAEGFSEGLHAELARDGIHVTTVVPGLMRTGSHLNAHFLGQHRKEYAWFAVAAASPFVSIDARRAARRIVAAARARRTQVILGGPAKLASLFHGIWPGATMRLLALVNRLLPSAKGVPTPRYLGRDSESRVTRSPLTAPGRRAGSELNQSS